MTAFNVVELVGSVGLFSLAFGWFIAQIEPMSPEDKLAREDRRRCKHDTHEE